MLDEDEQELFARLAVFAGGCTLDAAEEVAGAELDVLEALVQKSLVRHSGERFWMLQTIRDYGLECLSRRGEADVLRRRHAEWFLAFAERAEPHLDGAEQAEWLGRLEEDVANIREAVAQPDLAGRLVAALRFFWAKRGYAAEGRRLVEDILPRLGDDEPAKRMALVTGSLLAVMQGDFEASITHGERAIELGEATGDETPRLEVASALGRSLLTVGEEERALALFADAAERGPTIGRPGLAAIALLNLGYVALLHGETSRSRTTICVARSRWPHRAASGTGKRARSLRGPRWHSRQGSSLTLASSPSRALPSRYLARSRHRLLGARARRLRFRVGGRRACRTAARRRRGAAHEARRESDRARAGTARAGAFASLRFARSADTGVGIGRRPEALAR